VLRNSKFSLTTPFSCFCNWIRLTADVTTIGVVDLFWQELLPHVVWPRCWQNPCPYQMLGGGEEVPGCDHLGGGGVSTAIHASFFDVWQSHLFSATCASRLLWSHPTGWQRTSMS
jgi:hypothetical protein